MEPGMLKMKTKTLRYFVISLLLMLGDALNLHAQQSYYVVYNGYTFYCTEYEAYVECTRLREIAEVVLYSDELPSSDTEESFDPGLNAPDTPFRELPDDTGGGGESDETNSSYYSGDDTLKCLCCGSKTHFNCECLQNPYNDPIDPETGLNDVTGRFENDLLYAMSYFCSMGKDIEKTYPQVLVFRMKVKFFIDNVKSGAIWDLKKEGGGYNAKEFSGMNYAIFNGEEHRFDDFGNIAYGVAALAMGFSEELAVMGAGLYQVYSDFTGEGSHADWSNISGYFDDTRDTQMIVRGFEIYKQLGGCF